MSDPSRTYTQPIGSLQKELAEMPYATGLGRLTEVKCPYTSPEQVQEAVRVGRLDLEFRASVILPKEYCLDENVRKARSETGRLARSDNAALQLRARSAFPVKVGRALVVGTEREAEVKAGLASKVAVGGGAQNAFGRLLRYYPKKGAVFSLRPPSEWEAKMAFANCGLPQGEAVRYLPLPLVRVNKDAENGFPVLKKGTDGEALAMCMSLAVQMRTTLASAPDLERALQAMDESHPSFFLLKGKAKYDLYSVSKVEEFALRFYNVVGRQAALLMQQVTQPFEEKQQSVPNSNSTWGLPLVRGGGEKIVAYLESRLANHKVRSVAYVHHGDDTWMVMQTGGKVVQFAMDCSSFDLTQHSDVTAPVHKVFHEQLAKVDEISAAIWHKLMRKRRVTIAGAVTVEMKHGGPSGMPLQSKVNDVLMELYCARLAARLEAEECDEGRVAALVEEEGKGLGFVVRLEQYQEFPGDLRAALARKHFVYLGYEFRCKPDGEVFLMADLPRMVAQLPYPTLGGYEKMRAVHMARMALKCAGVLINAGALWELKEMEPIYEMVADALSRAAGELDQATIDAELMSAAISGIYEALGPQSLTGLVRVLSTERLKRLWQDPRLDTYELGAWGDEMEEDLRVRERGELMARLTGKEPAERRLPSSRPRQALTCAEKQVGRLPPRPAQEARVKETGRGGGDERRKPKRGHRALRPESDSEPDSPAYEEYFSDDDSVWAWE